MSKLDRTTWDRLASRYDRVMPWFSSRYDAVRERLRRDLVGANRVLEVGAGTGQFTFDLAAVVPRVVATDVAPGMVARLRERVAASAASNVEIQEMGAEEIAAADGTFDAVLCANVLHVMERPDRAVRELARVLRNDGLLVAPTFCHGQHGLARATSRLLSLVSPFVAHTRFSETSLVRFIGSHGFTIAASENLGGWLPIVYVTGRRRADLAGAAS